MTLRVLLLVSVAFSTLVVAQTARDTALSAYENSGAYHVYDALLSTEFASPTSSGKPLAIAAETNSSSTAYSCLVPKGKSKPILASAIADYEKQNRRTYLLQHKFATTKPYELLQNDEVQMRFKRPAEGYVMKLSAVGFNSTKTVAVVHAEYLCPGLCGSGMFYVFQKRSGKWERLDWEGTSCVVAS